MSLSMVLSGATGQSQAELGQFLGVPSEPRALVEAYASLAQVRESKGFHVASRLDLALGAHPDGAWVEDLKRGFGAEVALNDFEKEAREATARIDAWFRKETGGRIPELFGHESLTNDTELVASSAIVFEEKWANRFRVVDTTDQAFTLVNGSTVSVPTLRGEKVRVGVAWGPRTEAGEAPMRSVGQDGPYWAAMPFEGGEFVLLLGLPRSTTSLPELEAELVNPGVASLLSSMQYSEREVRLPEVDWLTPSTDFNSVLMALGLRKAYAGLSLGRANLPGDCVLSRVLQRVRVRWNEEGAEFAAASSVVVGESVGAIVVKPLAFDHPFAFALVHRSTGMILVQGRVMNPLKY